MIVGLTGGIASGKTVVADFFIELGVPVIDADKVAHKVQLPHEKGYERIVEHFGDSILFEDGSINRKALGKIIFARESKRKLLNSLIHPLVFDEMERERKRLRKQHPIIILSIPLLFETASYKQFDKILIAYAGAATQLQRLMKRDSITSKDAQLRINAQIPIDKKKNRGIIINTEKSFSKIKNDVCKVYEMLLKENESKK